MTATDALHSTIDDICDRYRRRAVALQTGGSSQSMLASSPGPLAGAEPTDELPTLLWPDQKHLIPTRCPRPHCGGTKVQVDPPYGALIRGDATCLLCTRVLVNLKASGTRPIPPTTSSADTRCERCETNEAAPHRRHCWGCAARIRAERLNAAPLAPCADCGQRPRTVKHARCNSCRHRIYANRTGAAR